MGIEKPPKILEYNSLYKEGVPAVKALFQGCAESPPSCTCRVRPFSLNPPSYVGTSRGWILTRDAVKTACVYARPKQRGRGVVTCVGSGKSTTSIYRINTSLPPPSVLPHATWPLSTLSTADGMSRETAREHVKAVTHGCRTCNRE